MEGNSRLKFGQQFENRDTSASESYSSYKSLRHTQAYINLSEVNSMTDF